MRRRVGGCLAAAAVACGSAVGTVLGVALGSYGYLVAFVFEGGRSFEAGTVDYYLLLPGVVRNAPAIDPVGGVRYYAAPVDGTSRQEEAISYASTATGPELRDRLDTYLRDRGYAPGPGVGWSGPDGYLELTVEDVGSRRQVELCVLDD